MIIEIKEIENNRKNNLRRHEPFGLYKVSYILIAICKS